MKELPLIEMLAFFPRYEAVPTADWRPGYRRDLLRVRSCHSKEKGGVRRSYYTIDTKQGERVDLVFDEEQLLWSLDKTVGPRGKAIDRMLALVDRHKHKPSRAHRSACLPRSLPPNDEDHSERTEGPRRENSFDTLGTGRTKPIERNTGYR